MLNQEGTLMIRVGCRLASLGALCLALTLILAVGCAPSNPAARSRDSAPAALDTLVVRLTPGLAEWFGLWRRADPEFEPFRLLRHGHGPFTLHDIRHYDLRDPAERRRRHLYGVFAPDSERFLDPDRGFDVAIVNGLPVFAHGPDSTAALVDLKARSISNLEPTGLKWAADGALWLDPERFALTGTLATDDSTGRRCGFVLAYDLHSGDVSEFRTPAVDATSFHRYLAARDSVLLGRLRAPAN